MSLILSFHHCSCLAFIQRGAILPKPFKSGDKIIGLMSSGVHSNGFSLVRKVVEKLGISYDDDAPFQPGMLYVSFTARLLDVIYRVLFG